MAAQESLLNAYRCLFGVDVQVVPGGCDGDRPADGPVQPEAFHGPFAESEIAVRDRLVAAQESLLNAYRCLFGVDVQVVPGGCDGGRQLSVEFQEGSALRVASFAEAGAGGWRLSGPDAGLFEIAGGVLRFSVDDARFLPDFERPADAGGDNRYETTVSGPGGERQVRVTVRDRDEPGTVRLSEWQPKVGVPLRARLSDPDRGVESVSWRWERSVGAESFVPIEGADEAVYVPEAADLARWLRAVATYADRHSGTAMATAVATSASVVIGPRLVGLSASSEGFPDGEGLVPAFHPDVLHYKIPCLQADVVSVAAALPAGTRLDVNGVQPPPGAETGAAVAVTETSDVVVTLARADGAFTRYVVHCAPEPLASIRTRVSAEMPLDVLLAVVVGQWIAVIDQHGVPRFHRGPRPEDRGDNAGFFLRSFGAGPARQWAHATETDNGLVWTILDAALAPIGQVAAAPPLTTTGRHDLRLLDDGSVLLMTYEPAVRDFSYLSDRSGDSSPVAAVRFDDPDGQRWGAAVDTADSAIQILNPDGRARWTWSSWGRIPLEDCAAHRFPDDYAHVNSLEMTAGGVLASFRGCSTVMLLDPDAPDGAEIVWRIGQTNLAPDHWEQRGLGPAPLRLVGDPLGAFCGQHAASLLRGGPEDRLLLFDNGVACVIDPSTGLPLSRPGGEYSRAVEYAIDPVNGEAVFVRDHFLGGQRSALVKVGGHVEALADGTWLISWSGSVRVDSQPDSPSAMPPPDALVTLVDPRTRTEMFSILAAGSGGPAGRLRAVPISALALEVPLPPLTAAFTDAEPVALPAGRPADTGASPDQGTTSADTGASPDQEAIGVAVAFSRPVKDIKPDTPSIEVDGGTLTAVVPRLEFGKPANSYILAIAPHGTGRVTVRLLPNQPCDQNGICTADDTPLATAPTPWTNSSG
ncbi:MAG: hypothetical protein F4Y28_00035 [Acidimicrobiia bacterium]|nr:hypothetical protein [Acidimicrobiia bacterium]MYB08349.1 hypothetical protein [Acidimicrobiia bacterium]